jgi:thiamine biosynthesis lipoprotein
MEVTGSSVRLLKPACIDLGGIAKGFAVDRAVSALKAGGCSLGLVNAGGDIAGFGPQPWPIQVVQPESRAAIANVAVCNGAVATSSLLPDGTAGHLPEIDSQLASATVCAPAAIDADALTKIVLSGSPLAARCLRLADAQAFALGRDGKIRAIEPDRQAA